MAKQAFDEVVEHMDQLDKSKQAEAATILQFLKENLN